MLTQSLNVFGVRHLSPNTAFQLLQYLELHQPKYVLIEGPIDATDLMLQLATTTVKPPVALLAYTNQLPIQTLLYPFAEYSPEYQAIKWAKMHRAKVQFIDLPTAISLALKESKTITEEKRTEQQQFYRQYNHYYQQIAAADQADNYDEYWEQNFESIESPSQFSEAIHLQSTSLRELVIDEERMYATEDYAYNELRESYMRYNVQTLLDSGVNPQEIVIIVGAYHVKGMDLSLPIASVAAIESIEKVATKICLMPYSNYRLSHQSGYGAGNVSPHYFQMIWEHLINENRAALPTYYIAAIAEVMRKDGQYPATANVIEAVRLAQMLAQIRNHIHPTLQDLQDAVVTCLGNGELLNVASYLQMINVGTKIGFVPEGVSQTPIQDDFNRNLDRLKLSRYKTLVPEVLDLDLRENLKVKSVAAAFLDLNRSIFLHRLQTIGIEFGAALHRQQENASWSEKWSLHWKPEIEIAVVEANLKGETIEIATAFHLKQLLESATNIEMISTVIMGAYYCDLLPIFEVAIHHLQSQLVESSDFVALAAVTHELSHLYQYGSIRKIDLEPLIPIIQQLFLRASLVMVAQCNCDALTAPNIMSAINQMDQVNNQLYDSLDSKTWSGALEELAQRDDLNATLSGLAFAILLENNVFQEVHCQQMIAFRMSIGVPVDIAAAWFEGFSNRNRYALLSRAYVWQAVDEYVHNLDDEQFKRANVTLRRALSDFSAAQKDSLATLLGELWGVDSIASSTYINAPLSADEAAQLDELNDFDFDF